MKKTIIMISALLILGALLVFTQVGRGLAQASDAKIKSAMSAAPMSIAKDATILDTTGETLRKGTNDWTCFPDDPASPGNDPACYDKTWMAAIQAATSGKKPNVTIPGFAYMLQGGSHASNTDPSAAKPAAGQDWMNLPPHMMIIFPSNVDISSFGTDSHTVNSFIMFAGTPLQHLMVPVADSTMDMSK